MCLGEDAGRSVTDLCVRKKTGIKDPAYAGFFIVVYGVHPFGWLTPALVSISIAIPILVEGRASARPSDRYPPLRLSASAGEKIPA